MRTLTSQEVYEALLEWTNLPKAMEKLFPELDLADRKVYKTAWGRAWYHVRNLLDQEALRKVPGTRSPVAYTRGRLWRTYEDAFLSSEEERRVRYEDVLPLTAMANRFYMKVLEAPWDPSRLEKEGWTYSEPSGVSQWVRKVNLENLDQPALKRFTVVWRDGRKSSSIVLYLDHTKVDSASSMEDLETINYQKVLAVQKWLSSHYGFRLSLATETPLQEWEAEIPESVVLAAKELGIADGQLVYFDQSLKGRGGKGHVGTRDQKVAWNLFQLPQTAQKVEAHEETLEKVRETLQSVQSELQGVRERQLDHVQLIESMAELLQETGRALARSQSVNQKLLEFIGEGRELDMKERDHGYQ